MDRISVASFVRIKSDLEKNSFDFLYFHKSAGALTIHRQKFIFKQLHVFFLICSQIHT